MPRWRRRTNPDARQRPGAEPHEHANGWRTTSCWPTSWRSSLIRRPICARPRVGRIAGTGQLKVQGHRRPALCSDRSPASNAGGDKEQDMGSPTSACCGCSRAMSAGERPRSPCWPWLIAVEAGMQVALMAPTEILVRQHLAWLQPFAAAEGAPPDYRPRPGDDSTELWPSLPTGRSISWSAPTRCSRRP